MGYSIGKTGQGVYPRCQRLDWYADSAVVLEGGEGIQVHANGSELDEFPLQSENKEGKHRKTTLIQLELLDFGASRGFSQEFIDDYIAILKAAADVDREACRVISLRLGYLTGRETEVRTRYQLTLVHAECTYRFNFSHCGAILP